MLNIDFSSKRSKLALRFFSYGVMTVATVALTTAVVFLMLGYRIDRSFNFLQGGLIQFRSFPSSAMVVVDGKKQNFRTPNKMDLKSGKHNIEMSLTGYRSWSKAVDLSPGQLTWLNYARLIPNNITTNNVRTLDGLSGAMGSPDHRWLLLQPAPDAPNLLLADLNNEKKPEFSALQLPDTLFSKKDNKLGTIEIVEWDLGSRYVLLKHKNGDIREFIRMDRAKPQDSINMTRVFSLNIVDAHFSGANSNIVFAKTDDVLRRLDLANINASAALVSNMKQFIVYGEDTVAFVNEQEATIGEPATKQQIVGIYRHGKITPVRTQPLNQPTVIAYNEYDNHGYLALGSSDSAQVSILRDPTMSGPKDGDLFARFDLGALVGSLSFSPNGRMLIAQQGNQTATFDIEQSQTYMSKLGIGANVASQLKWLDDFHVWTDAGNKLTILEFDGQNAAEITSVSTGFTSQLSSNGRVLFSINKSTADNKFFLQVSNLTTD
jgi:hypothetical protein